MANDKILFVDDEEKILSGIQRQQGDDFNISVALGAKAALEIVEEEGPFAVVVSDMRMPDVNGIELLARIRKLTPNSVRMILTGFAELSSTIEAVNEGHIFRFLSKPCDEGDMALALKAGLRQFALVEAEKELVEGTLHGSVNVLSEVLSLVSPLAFGQSSRVRSTVDAILKRVNVQNQWQLEIAAMLSSLGCVALPPDLLQKKIEGQALSRADEKVFAQHPKLAAELLQSIPRLENVAEIIGSQADEPEDAVEKSSVAVESQILKLAIDFDRRELNAESSLHALSELESANHLYAPDIIEALGEYVKSERDLCFAELMPDLIREGMILAEDLRNEHGVLLMSKGQKITAAAQRLIENFANSKNVIGPIKVIESKSVCSAV